VGGWCFANVILLAAVADQSHLLVASGQATG
jgi:hypothetical protein